MGNEHLRVRVQQRGNQAMPAAWIAHKATKCLDLRNHLCTQALGDIRFDQGKIEPVQGGVAGLGGARDSTHEAPVEVISGDGPDKFSPKTAEFNAAC